jgi:hypothetical protein
VHVLVLVHVLVFVNENRRARQHNFVPTALVCEVASVASPFEHVHVYEYEYEDESRGVTASTTEGRR